MYFTKAVLACAAFGSAVAQRPSSTPICDYYTTALFTENTGANQLALLTALVNTVVIGNYTQPNVGVVVPGILAKGTFNGTEVNLLPFFDGTANTTNRGGTSGVSVNFLDGGGAAPLMQNKPATDESSNQYFLLTHLYQFFGALLGCTLQGASMSPFLAYSGTPSMFEVHKFMRLTPPQFGYFVTQVGLAASSFGVSAADVQAVGTALQSAFGMRCAPEAEVVKGQGPQLQAICVAEACPLAQGAVCARYEGGAAVASGTGTGTGTGTAAAPSATASTAGAAGAGWGGMGLVAGTVGGFAVLLM